MLNWWRKKQKQPSGESAAQPEQIAPSSPAEIQQTVRGDRNQVIANAENSTIINTQNILPTAPPSLTGIPSNLQERGSRTFVGRNNALEELHRKLQANQAPAITALQGMGGIGKTEMAVQYAQQYKHHYPSGVCWLSTREAEVGTQLVNFAVTVLGLSQPEGELTDQVNYVWNRWPHQDAGERGLLIYDDVVDYGDIQGLLPTDERFQVLLTTRLQNLAAGVEDFQLELLNQESALELLRKIVDGATRTTRIDDELTIAKALCERVGYLPLGLELLGYFLQNKPSMSLQKLQQRLEKNQLNAKALQMAHPGMTAKLGVYEAFELSWGELSEAGQEMACCLSLFALAPIQWELITEGDDSEVAEEDEDIRDDELLKLNLLQHLGEDRYQLHQLVREFFFAKLTERDDRESLQYGYCDLMLDIASQMPQQPTQAIINRLSPMVPHMEEVTARWLSLLGEEDEDDLLLPFLFLARFYNEKGAYAQVEHWYKACLATCRERFGNEHRFIPTSLNNLAALYESQGRYDKAEPLHVEALKLRQQLLGTEHPLVAVSLNNLAILYSSQGRYDEAEPLHLRSLALRRKLKGTEHPAVAKSLINIAGLYVNQGRYDEAEPLYLEALAIQEKLSGEDYLPIVVSLVNLASLYETQARHKESEPLFLRALEIQKTFLGVEHPDIATTLNSLAGAYVSQNRYEEAEALYKEALAMRQCFLGEEHLNIAVSLNDLAILYGLQDRYEEAEQLHKKALAMRQTFLGDEHPGVGASLNALGLIHLAQERYDDASERLHQALSINGKALGRNHPKAAINLSNLALLYTKKENFRTAEYLLHEALRIFRQVFDSDHPDITLVFDRFIDLVKAAIVAGEADTLTDHPMTQDFMRELSSSTEDQAE